MAHDSASESGKRAGWKPTLCISVEDDRFGTAATARHIAGQVPGARLVIYPSGGHIWLGHDAELADEVAGFVTHLTY